MKCGPHNTRAYGPLGNVNKRMCAVPTTRRTRGDQNNDREKEEEDFVVQPLQHREEARSSPSRTSGGLGLSVHSSSLVVMDEEV